MHVKKSVIFEEKFPTYQMILNQSLWSHSRYFNTIWNQIDQWDVLIFIYLRSCRGLWHVNFGHENFKFSKKKNFISYQLFLVRRAKFITKSISRLGARQITRIDLGGRSNACRGNNLPNVTARTFFLQVIPFLTFFIWFRRRKVDFGKFCKI